MIGDWVRAQTPAASRQKGDTVLRAGRPQDDDWTVVVIDWGGEDAPLVGAAPATDEAMPSPSGRRPA